MFSVKQLLFLFQCVILVYGDCLTNINRDHNKILLIQNGKIRDPDDAQGNVKLMTNEVLTLGCPGGEVTATNTVFVDAKCKGKDQFIVGNRMYTASQLVCSTPPLASVINVGNCLKEKTALQLGFDIAGKGFISQLDLCFDDRNKATLYVNATMSSHIMAAQSVLRPDFKPSAPYIPRALGEKYHRIAQQATLEAILSKPGQGLPKYMDKDALMDVGHCAAKADFIYKPQQIMTFHYINAAPQWTAVNTGNWDLLESNLRALVAQKNKQYDVYTGTYGVLELLKKDSSSLRAKIYLDHLIELLPSPLYYWKVVVEKDGDTGIALIGMNNVFEPQVDPCENIIARVTWMKDGKWDNYKAGYIVACDINKFKSIVGLKEQLPVLPIVNHLLLN